MTITLMWWHVPMLISVLSLVLAVFWPSKEDLSTWYAIMVLLRMVPALLVSCLAWAVAAFMK